MTFMFNIWCSVLMANICFLNIYSAYSASVEHTQKISCVLSKVMTLKEKKAFGVMLSSFHSVSVAPPSFFFYLWSLKNRECQGEFNLVAKHQLTQLQFCSSRSEIIRMDNQLARPSEFFQTRRYRPAATAYSVLEMVTCQNSKHNTSSL